MLGAALKRLDRELKQRRPAQTPAVVATAAPVEAAAAAAVPGRSHVESLMRMRREALDQRKRDDEGKTTASNVGVEAYRSAQEALRAQKFTRAHEFMQKALAADPNNAIYLMYQKWAAFRSNLLDEEGVSKLRAELREKVSDDLHRAFAYYALGHIALADKKDEAAERFFARAVELDKENKDAERHMRILELRRKNVDQDRQKKIFGIEVGKRS
jgi:tetratricopeptide (TPR) repeat protein